MRTVNTVTLLGNVVRPPERRITAGGKSFVTFMMATQREVQKYGDKVSESEFHNVVAWGGLAGIAGNFCKKGSLIYVEGSLKTRSWNHESGSKMFKTEIIANNIISLKSPRSREHDTDISQKIPDEEFFTATHDDFFEE